MESLPEYRSECYPAESPQEIQSELTPDQRNRCCWVRGWWCIQCVRTWRGRMLAKNLDVARGLVNVVVGFEGSGKALPKVRFVCGVTEVMKTERWVIKAQGRVYLSRQQLPLKLAWAISIHKSQGMTLDCEEISLSRVFVCSQAYVALSRARSLEGLRVMDFDANPYVLQFYARMKKERAQQPPASGKDDGSYFAFSRDPGKEVEHKFWKKSLLHLS